MSAPLRDEINNAMKAAMKAKQKDRLSVIRQIQSALKQVEVDERIELDDDRILAILDKLVKQRRESIKQYQDGGRPELAEQEQTEIEVIQEFLPQPLSGAEIDALIDEAIQATGASSMQDMGKLMGSLKPQLQGRADMGQVSQKVKAKLG